MGDEPGRARPATQEEIEALGGGRIRVLGGATFLTGLTPNGIKVAAKNENGWLHVDITADESVKGYAITVNGKDVPITQPGPSYNDLAKEAERQSREEGYRFD